MTHAYPPPNSERRTSAGIVRRRRGVNVVEPKTASDVPGWLVKAYGAPLLTESPGNTLAVRANTVSASRTPEMHLDDAIGIVSHRRPRAGFSVAEGDAGSSAGVWSTVVEAINLAGSRLVGGAAAWSYREHRERLLGDLTEARRARHHARRGDRFPGEADHALAVFLNTLEVCAPRVPIVVRAALAWWLRLREASPFGQKKETALQRLADRHWRADSVEAVEGGVELRRRARRRPSSTTVPAKRVAERIMERAPRRRQRTRETLARAAASTPLAPSTRAGRKRPAVEAQTSS